MKHLFKGFWVRLTYDFNSTHKKFNPNCRLLCGKNEAGSWKAMEGLVRCSANSVPLSPIIFLERAAKVCSDRTSVVYGDVKYRWDQTHQRCLKLASAITRLGVSRGAVVSILAPNIPALYELHFAVPMAGAILCTLNSRHDSSMISTLLAHSESKIIFVDHHLLHIAQGALDLLQKAGTTPPILVLIPEPDSPPSLHNSYEYETTLKSGNSNFQTVHPESEWDPISINYTSGTTSSPKGVVYSHRSAYLNTLATILLYDMGPTPSYLWTVPMFHGHGWGLTWGVAAQGGTNICLRRVDPKSIFDTICLHKVTHMGGAPTVLNMIVNAPVADRKPLPHKVHVMTGGAPPPPRVLSKMEDLGFGICHVYGLTETCGPATSCAWRPEWDAFPAEDRSRMKSRQGVEHVGVEVDVKDSVTMESSPEDGTTVGEVMFRGNTVMSGYLKDTAATAEAFRGGWLRSGDLAVKHRGGFIEVKDRVKDVVISGGENVCTVEVETVLYGHPAVLEAAVVARPDEHWGQTVCAFVEVKDGFEVGDREIIEFCRKCLPHYMAPRTVVFGDLPKTATGKVKKFVLRERAEAMGSIS